MALQTKNPAFMAGMAKLAQEEMDEVIRRSVKKNGVIDVRYLDREVNALVAPFADFPSLLEVAKKEVFHVNTFRMSMGDTKTRAYLRSRYAIGEMPSTIGWQSLTTGPISSDIHKIRHLEVRSAICLNGSAEFRFPAINSMLFWDDKLSDVMKELENLMPKLETLEVKIHNTGFLTTDQSFYTLPDRKYIRITDPRAERWRKAEQMLRMHRYLLWFGAMFDPPTLREKSVEFIHDATPKPPVACDGLVFHRQTGPWTPSEYAAAHYWRDCQAAMMVSEMTGLPKMEYPKQYINETLAYRLCATTEEIERAIDLESGKKAREATETMLKFDKAIIHFPCSLCVVHKEEESEEK